jgi:hypothetical protein
MAHRGYRWDATLLIIVNRHPFLPSATAVFALEHECVATKEALITQSRVDPSTGLRPPFDLLLYFPFLQPEIGICVTPSMDPSDALFKQNISMVYDYIYLLSRRICNIYDRKYMSLELYSIRISVIRFLIFFLSCTLEVIKICEI